MGTKAYGRILGWEGASLWILRAPPGEQYPRTDFHAHHAIQLTIALTGQVELEGDAGRVSGVALGVAPDARHSFGGTGLVAHLFLAPESQAGRAIARGLFSSGPIARLPEELLGDLPAPEDLGEGFSRYGVWMIEPDGTTSFLGFLRYQSDIDYGDLETQAPLEPVTIVVTGESTHPGPEPSDVVVLRRKLE